MSRRRNGPPPSRKWICTAFSISEADTALLPYITDIAIGVNNLVSYTYQLERCPTTGRVHLQGCFYFDPPVRRTHVQRIVRDRTANCRVPDGTPEQNRTYCSKPDSRVRGPWMSDEMPPGSGKRTDLETVAADLRAGHSLKQLSDDHTVSFLRYHRGMEKYLDLHPPAQRTTFNTVHVFWGPTGTGKSWRARHAFPDAYWAPIGNTMWYDGYAGESCIIYDDFDPRVLKYHDFLSIAQENPCRLPIKGGFVVCLATDIVLTSNVDPRRWWPDQPWGPVERRVSITHMDTPYVDPQRSP